MICDQAHGVSSSIINDDISINNLIQTVCVHAQCDFRNIDDGILQQVNDNHKQGNVSPGISSVNEQRWLDYLTKIVTQSDCSDEMLSMMIIVPYMFKHEHNWWTRIDWRVTVPLAYNVDVTKHAMMRTVYVSMHTGTICNQRTMILIILSNNTNER